MKRELTCFSWKPEKRDWKLASFIVRWIKNERWDLKKVATMEHILLSLSPCQTRSLSLNFPSWLKIYALLHAWICMHATIQPCISDPSHPMMDKRSNFGSHERCRIPVSMSTSLSMGPTCTYVKGRSLSMGPTCSRIQKGVYISTVEPYCGPRWGPYYHFKNLNH